MSGNDPKSTTGGKFVSQPEDFQVTSPVQLANFRTSELEPQSPLYIGVADKLIVHTALLANTNFALVTVRILAPNGKIVTLPFRVPAGSNHTIFTNTFPLEEGWLLSVAVVSETVTLINSMHWAQVGIARAGSNAAAENMVLCAGYLNAQVPLGWPGNLAKRPTEDTCPPHSFALTTPGAGAEFTQTVLAGARWRVQSFSILLTTGVAAANRFPTLVLDDGATIYAQIPPVALQLASLAVQYTWMDSAPISAVINGVALLPLPGNLIMPAGHRIRTLTAGIQGADQYSVPNILIHETHDPL